MSSADSIAISSEVAKSAESAASESASVPRPSIAAASGESKLTSDLSKLNISQEERDRQKKPAAASGQGIRYAAERVIGNGSFGVVYQATVIDTGETVAIKKVLQDVRFKNRELQIMGMLEHPDVIGLRHCFYSKGDKAEEVYLNLVMEFVPETIHRCIRTYTKAGKLVPIQMVKCYLYQISRSLAYIHSLGITHRDLKPQNLLLSSKTNRTKLCDFGSAKMLVAGEANVAYICSRYYRAPELVFEATQYTTAIDVWSMGCVFAELMLGTPLFPGESAVDQLIEIIKILGTPTREEIFAMNPNHSTFNFPSIKPHPWAKVFRNKAPADAIDLLSQWLRYDPKTRLDGFDSLAHPFFDELRDPAMRMPGGSAVPPHMFQFTEAEMKLMQQRGLTKKLIPKHLWEENKLNPETGEPMQ